MRALCWYEEVWRRKLIPAVHIRLGWEWPVMPERVDSSGWHGECSQQVRECEVDHKNVSTVSYLITSKMFSQITSDCKYLWFWGSLWSRWYSESLLKSKIYDWINKLDTSISTCCNTHRNVGGEKHYEFVITNWLGR